MFWEATRLAFQAITKNPVRSVLTILGIVIGVSAVIAMVTIGRGSSRQVQANVEKLGTNILMITPGQRRMGPQTAGASAAKFDLKDIDRIIDEISVVQTGAPMGSASSVAVYGNENHRTQVRGTDVHYFEATDWAVEDGRLFEAAEEAAGRSVCILGSSLKHEIFGRATAVGEKVRLKTMSCTVIGVLAAKGASSMGADQDDVVFVPFRTFARRIAGTSKVPMIYVAVRKGGSTSQAIEDISDLLREIRRIDSDEEDDFSIMDMKQIASMLAGISNVLTGMLSAIAAVSLLVGGIGIMNIMLVSVVERTREIGIRLSVGAQASQILLQFLVESVILSLLGGVIGIVLGLSLGAIGASALNVPFLPEPGVVLLAFLFSALVGVVFGYVPARAAAHMDPIDALRHQ